MKRCADMRCGCGNLLARWVAGGVELKCRSCKRTIVVPVENFEARSPVEVPQNFR